MSSAIRPRHWRPTRPGADRQIDPARTNAASSPPWWTPCARPVPAGPPVKTGCPEGKAGGSLPTCSATLTPAKMTTKADSTPWVLTMPLGVLIGPLFIRDAGPGSRQQAMTGQSLILAPGKAVGHTGNIVGHDSRDPAGPIGCTTCLLGSRQKTVRHFLGACQIGGK